MRRLSFGWSGGSLAGCRMLEGGWGLAEVGIMGPFVANSGGVTMSGIDDRFVRQGAFPDADTGSLERFVEQFLKLAELLRIFG